MTDPQRPSENAAAAPAGAGRPPDAPGTPRRIVDSARRVASTAVAGAEAVVDTVASAGGRLADLAEPVTTYVAPPVRLATRAWRRAEARRLHSLRSRARQSLPNLYEIHPEARNAPIRHIGLREVPLSEIAGTAVEGPAQRGGDFLPLPQLRGANWIGRWARIRNAVDRMEILPPIELVHAGGAYWVVDGHNRVAAALYAGQVAIDAIVTAVQLPGDPLENPTHDDLEALIEEGEQVRAAGTGRLSPGGVAVRRSERHPVPGETRAESESGREGPPWPSAREAAPGPSAREAAPGPSGPERTTQPPTGRRPGSTGDVTGAPSAHPEPES